VRSCPQISSKVQKPLYLPTAICSHGPSDGRLSELKVTFYPKVIVVQPYIYPEISAVRSFFLGILD